MDNSVARNVLLLVLAMAVGATLGAAAKFGLGHELGMDSGAEKPDLVRTVGVLKTTPRATQN